MMPKLSELDPSSEPIALGDRAREDLRFIRRTMERGAAFTAVPGLGGVGMGCTALVAAALASRQATPEAWLLVWVLEAVVAVAIGVVAIHRKARRASLAVLSGGGRTFVLSFLPPALAGAVLTIALWQTGAHALLPGAWLLLYGAAVVTAGTFAVRIVPTMGICFMVLGALTLLWARDHGDLAMAAGFGGLQIVFGTIIARRHGG
ncbi:MAG: hypothetical protein MJB57_05850 [Gemmatimonadetes bacterium]|nr:hypothetical protein [Gemmatimonadota bacterium]